MPLNPATLTNEELIRAGCRWDFFRWQRRYLPGVTKVRTPEFHKEIVSIFDDRANKYIAIAAPRGHAKTSLITRGWVIQQSLEGFEPFFVILGQEHDLAAEHTAAIYEIIRNNDRIQDEYRPVFLRERLDDLIIQTKYGVSRIAAFGHGQSTRGLLEGKNAQRPTFALGDDLEENKRVMNPVLRDEDHDWLVSVVLPMLDPMCGRAALLGTILNEDSVLARHTGLYGECKRDPMPGWVVRLYRGIQDDGKALWPEWQSAEKLLADKAIAESANRGHLWYQEIQNDPRRGKDAEFSENWIQYVDLSDSTKREWWDKKKDTLNYYFTCDTSWAKKNPKSDFSAGVVTAWDEYYNCFVMPPVRGKWGIFETWDEIVKLKKLYPVKRYGIERGATKSALDDVLTRENRLRGWQIRFDDLDISCGNEALIRAFFMLFSRGEVYFVGKPEEFKDLIEELKSFPNGVHDDLAVAVSHSVQIARPAAKREIPKPAHNSGSAIIDELLKVDNG